jgi:hypothetical protein
MIYRGDGDRNCAVGRGLLHSVTRHRGLMICLMRKSSRPTLNVNITNTLFFYLFIYLMGEDTHRRLRRGLGVCRRIARARVNLLPSNRRDEPTNCSSAARAKRSTLKNQNKNKEIWYGKKITSLKKTLNRRASPA